MHCTSSTEALATSWEAVKAIPNYEVVTVEILYRKVFQLAPEAQKLWSFHDPQNPEALFSHPLFVVHSKAVMHMLNAAVELTCSGRSIETAEAASTLGRKHFYFGVDPQHYPVLQRALMHALKTALGESKFTPTVESAWKRFYADVTSSMIEGAFLEEFEGGVKSHLSFKERVKRAEKAALEKKTGPACHAN